MANIRELVQRRKAIRNIRKITRTMELIATSRFKKALDRAVQAEAYTRKIGELAADLSQSAGEVTHPLLTKHETEKSTLLLVLGSNRGLCGGYNASILREAMSRVRAARAAGQELHLESSGKRPNQFFRFQQIPTERTYDYFEDKPAFAQVNELAERYIAAYTAGAVDRVEVVYMKFFNAGRQQPVAETLLPLEAKKADEPKKEGGPKAEYEYLPDAGGILQDILPESFKVRLFKCFLDAAVSEQIARRIAMKNATENADEIITDLSREYNRARQAKITKEIAEVIGRAAALE